MNESAPPDPPPSDVAEAAAAGWYPAEAGFVRWWDGAVWGPPVPAGADGSPRHERVALDAAARPRPLLPHAHPGDSTATMVTLTHLGFALGFLIVPLTVYLVVKDQPYVRHHAAESLNFQLTVLGVLVLSVPLMAIYVGFFTFAAAAVADVALGITAARAARRGEWWRYPLSVRLVKP